MNNLNLNLLKQEIKKRFPHIKKKHINAIVSLFSEELETYLLENNEMLITNFCKISLSSMNFTQKSGITNKTYVGTYNKIKIRLAENLVKKLKRNIK